MTPKTVSTIQATSFAESDSAVSSSHVNSFLNSQSSTSSQSTQRSQQLLPTTPYQLVSTGTNSQTLQLQAFQSTDWNPSNGPLDLTSTAALISNDVNNNNSRENLTTKQVLSATRLEKLCSGLEDQERQIVQIIQDCEVELLPHVKYRAPIAVTLSLMPFFTFYKLIFTLLFVLMNFTRRVKKVSTSYSVTHCATEM